MGDSLGELALYYSLADAALLGGSFEKLGGQNLIEGAAAGCPIIIGPHPFNFAEAARLAVGAGAAFSCADITTAVDAALNLVFDRPTQLRVSKAATAFALGHQGATDRTVRALAVFFKT